MTDSVFNSLGQEIPNAKLVDKTEPTTLDGYGYISGKVVKPDPGYGCFNMKPSQPMPPPPIYPSY